MAFCLLADLDCNLFKTIGMVQFEELLCNLFLESLFLNLSNLNAFTGFANEGSDLKGLLSL